MADATLPCQPGAGYPALKGDDPWFGRGWPGESEAARRMCLAYCPMLRECRSRVLRKPSQDQPGGIVGGLGLAERMEITIAKAQARSRATSAARRLRQDTRTPRQRTNAAYYAAHRDEILASAAKRYAANRDQILAARRAARRSDPAEAALVRDPYRSNRLAAREAGVSERQIRQARERLERAGDIPEVPAHARAMRGPPGPAPGSPQARHHASPSVRELPPPPDWSRGLCTTLQPHQCLWWTSDDRDEREAAARYCASCPVLADCRAWSLCLPWDDRDSVYGGLLPGQRLRLKRQRQQREAIMHQVLEGIRWP